MSLTFLWALLPEDVLCNSIGSIILNYFVWKIGYAGTASESTQRATPYLCLAPYGVAYSLITMSSGRLEQKRLCAKVHTASLPASKKPPILTQGAMCCSQAGCIGKAGICCCRVHLMPAPRLCSSTRYCRIGRRAPVAHAHAGCTAASHIAPRVVAWRLPISIVVKHTKHEGTWMETSSTCTLKAAIT